MSIEHFEQREEIDGTLTIFARTGGIKINEMGDTWINPHRDIKETVLAQADVMRGWIGKRVAVTLSDANTYERMVLAEDQATAQPAQPRTPVAKPVKASTEGSLLKSEYVINIQGKEFVSFQGLLDVAHTKGLKGISTSLVSGDFENKQFIFKACVTMDDGSFFESYGDAHKDNVKSMISAHIMRMAETRAIARALRWATNIGMTSLEEVGDDKDGA